MKLNQNTGTAIQIGGSAAGFTIFFYLLSSGLNPYKDLEVYIYDDRGDLMQHSDGEFEVTIASRIRQEKETSNGQVTFSIPRSEKNVRLHVKNVSGRLWDLDKISPNSCILRNDRVSAGCDSIDVHLKKGEACLSDHSVVSYETEPINTTLAIVLDTLKETTQRISEDLPVFLEFSDSVIGKKLHTLTFSLERKNDSSRSICEHLGRGRE